MRLMPVIHFDRRVVRNWAAHVQAQTGLAVGAYICHFQVRGRVSLPGQRRISRNQPPRFEGKERELTACSEFVSLPWTARARRRTSGANREIRVDILSRGQAHSLSCMMLAESFAKERA